MKRKRFLLTAINAKYIHSNLAVYSLRAVAKAKGFSVELAEFTINDYVEHILQEIYKREPEVLFFSCYLWNWEYVRELTAECRKILPDTPIWVGGPEVSYDAAKVLKNNPAITGVMIGEGEESFPRLLACYEQGIRAFEEIEGLAFRDGEQIRINPQTQLMDLNEIPFPYEDLGELKNKILYYESSRGCPFACSYCLSSIDKRIRFRNVERVKRELMVFLEAKVPQVKFVDRTFNCKESHAVELWNFLLENDNGVTNFHFEIAADMLTDGELAILKKMRPGLIQLEIGVQSTNPQTLEAIRRTMDFALVQKRVRQVKSFQNIHQHLDLIAGLPYEGLESFQKSFDDVFALRPEQLQLGFLKILKGSRMEEQAAEFGIQYREKAPYEVLCTDWVSYGELVRLKGVEQMVELYYNSQQFSMTLREVLKEWNSAFSFFEELAAFYEKYGWNKIQHARARRYEILLEFLSENTKGTEKQEYYRELLTFDYYLREPAKSRPTFAVDISPWKEELRILQKRYGREKHIEVQRFGQAKKDGENLADGTSITFWLFDYGNRNPLTKDAALTRIDLESPDKKEETL